MKIMFADIRTGALRNKVCQWLPIVSYFPCDLFWWKKPHHQIKSDQISTIQSIHLHHDRRRSLTRRLESYFPANARNNVDFPQPGGPITRVILRLISSYFDQHKLSKLIKLVLDLEVVVLIGYIIYLEGFMMPFNPLRILRGFFFVGHRCNDPSSSCRHDHH